MKQKIKNFCLFLSVVFSGLLFPFQSVSAVSFLVNLVSWLPLRILTFVFYLAAMLCMFFAQLAAKLLSWVIGPNFTNFPYTKPGIPPEGNPIIQIGLGVTQGFVNMVLVLVLVYIALATILRLAGYETKKLLATFILIALLVNFAPVICGLIVDASNIVMNYFLTKVDGDVFVGAMINRANRVIAEFVNNGLFAFDITTTIGYLLDIAAIMVLAFFLIFFLFLFTLIFALRYLMVWVLVILSPLAFACYILPSTKKYWTLWWNQFVQWSIIGITCGFFLYLAATIMVRIPTWSQAGYFGSPSKIPGSKSPELIGDALIYLVPIVFLGIGLVFGLQTSAMGASTVIGLTKRVGARARKAALWPGKRAWENIRPQISDKLHLKELAGGVTRTWEKTRIARWFLPEKLRKYAEFRPPIDEAQAKLKDYSSKEIGYRIARKADTGIRATAGLMELAKRGDMEDLMNAYRDKYKVKTDEELFKIKAFKKELIRPIDMSLKSGYLNTLVRRSPRLGRIAAFGNIGPYAGLSEDQGAMKATREARRQHINDWEREELEDKVVMETLMEKGREAWESIDTQVKLGQETSHKTINKIFSEYVDDVLTKEEPAVAEGAKKGTKEGMEQAWKKFREWFRSQPEHENREGYFRYVEAPRAEERGWKKGEYMTPEQRAEERRPPPTPGGAAVGPKPPPSGRRPSGTGPSGRPAGGITGGPGPSGRKP